MQRILNTTLVADGSSDRVLIPIIGMLLAEHCPMPWRETDFVRDYPPGTTGLADRVRHALLQYPCDILFVHRDAEQKGAVDTREAEIRAAVESLAQTRHIVAPAIAIVPVLMTEAWLLTDEAAIRSAAGNPAGREPLQLPDLRQVETVNAKKVLFDALGRAKNLGQRRSMRLQPQALRHRVAEYLDDLAALRKLASFARFESQLRDHFRAAETLNA